MGCMVNAAFFCVIFVFASVVQSENPYRFFTWTVTFGTISPLGVKQTGILINGQFPGPQLDGVTNDNIIINVINNLNQPFLLTWNGVQQRRNSWQDGVMGTNCPIPPGSNYTYSFQLKDQIGSYFYFPSTLFHKAAGGFGGITIANRVVISLPYPTPDGEHTLLIGDWYTANHDVLQRKLDKGRALGTPSGVHINGLGGQSRSVFKVEPGKTYRLRFSNVGLFSSLNVRIEGHMMKLVEVEGSHSVQNDYDSLDIHVGQSCAVLVTANQTAKDYYIVASTRFLKKEFFAVGILSYSNSGTPALGPLPPGPPKGISWSINQARTIRWNLTANAARPNPQGSYHYGSVNVTRTIVLANSANVIAGKQRFAVNGISYVVPNTPLKLADYFNISGVYSYYTFSDFPQGNEAQLPQMQTPVINAEYRTFIEIIFQNDEKSIQSWHIDGYNFFVVGMGRGKWTPTTRQGYNLFDAIYRFTTQVYPKSWVAVLFSLDNAGMWNMRSEVWHKQYLGQQLYMRIYAGTSLRDEFAPPKNLLTCGKAQGLVPNDSYSYLRGYSITPQ